MLRNTWSVLCNSVIENAKTHNVSLIEHIEKLTLSVPPDIPDSLTISVDFTLASQWFNDGDEGMNAAVQATVITPQENEYSQFVKPSLHIKPRSFARWYLNLKSFPLEGPGIYYLVLRVRPEGNDKWRRVATIPLQVEYNILEGAPMWEVPQMPETDSDSDEDE